MFLGESQAHRIPNNKSWYLWFPGNCWSTALIYLLIPCCLLSNQWNRLSQGHQTRNKMIQPIAIKEALFTSSKKQKQKCINFTFPFTFLLQFSINPLTSVPAWAGLDFARLPLALSSPRRAFLVPFCPSCLWEGLTNQNPPTSHVFEGLRGS